MTESQKAYVAGFFDGEGCLGAYRANNTLLSGERTPVYRPLLEMGNNDIEVLRWIKQLFGMGAIRQLTGTDCYILKFGRRAEMEAFLHAVLPYLRVKRSQALIMLELLAASRHREWDRVAELAEQLAVAKKRRRGPKASTSADGTSTRDGQLVSL